MIRGLLAMFAVSLFQPCLGSSAVTEDSIELEMPSGQSIEVTQFSGPGSSRVIWIPSERGIRNRTRENIRALAGFGYEVWLPDLHNGYFLQPGRDSLSQVPVDDITSLIEAAVVDNDGPLFLVSLSRGTQLALIAAREWQLKNPGKSRIRGLILIHSNLYANRPDTGQSATYLPVTRATNLPVYLLETEHSTKSLHLTRLVDELASGGSQVYSRLLKDVLGGFFAREESELNPASLVAREKFPAMLHQAFKLIGSSSLPLTAAHSSEETRQRSARVASNNLLHPLKTPVAAPVFKLADYFAGKAIPGVQPGQVTLVNFWASWCGPCVEEIPSLHRLGALLSDTDFVINTVNIGESEQRIGDFIQQVPMELPVLMDFDGEVARQWKIYVYPSSYLVDRDGIIRYAYSGALQWDTPEIVDVVKQLLETSG